MAHYQIENHVSGLVLGVYEGRDEHDALDALARDAGYDDYEDCCRATGSDSDLTVTVVSE